MPGKTRAMNDRYGYECIDPELGEQLGGLDAPGIDERLRQRLRIHLESCAACRLQREVGDELAAGLREGRLDIDIVAGPGRRPRAVYATGWLALAAGLALLLLLPPQFRSVGLMRDESEWPAIVSPVPEEVVGTMPTVRWTPIKAASSYRITVAAVDGAYSWSEQTAATRTEVRPAEPLPRGQRFRVTVEPVPAHLAPAGGLRSAFSTGRLDQIAAFRLRHAPPARWVLPAAGIMLLLSGAVAQAVGRRRSA